MNITDNLNLLVVISFALIAIVGGLSLSMYSRKLKAVALSKDSGMSVVHLPARGPGGHNYYLINKEGTVLDSWAGPPKE